MAINRLEDHAGEKKKINQSKTSRFLFKSLHFHSLQKKIVILPIQILIFQRLRKGVDAHISSLDSAVK